MNIHFFYYTPPRQNRKLHFVPLNLHKSLYITFTAQKYLSAPTHTDTHMYIISTLPGGILGEVRIQTGSAAGRNFEQVWLRRGLLSRIKLKGVFTETSISRSKSFSTTASLVRYHFSVMVVQYSVFFSYSHVFKIVFQHIISPDSEPYPCMQRMLSQAWVEHSE